MSDMGMRKTVEENVVTWYLVRFCPDITTAISHLMGSGHITTTTHILRYFIILILRVNWPSQGFISISIILIKIKKNNLTMKSFSSMETPALNVLIKTEMSIYSQAEVSGQDVPLLVDNLCPPAPSKIYNSNEI